MREMLFVSLLFAILFLLGAISPLTLFTEGMTPRDAARAYELAWEISTELEEWSNWIVDGDERFRVGEDELGRVFKHVEELIGLLCRELQSHGGRCRYEGY
jgi:hypothetical protein